MYACPHCGGTELRVEAQCCCSLSEDGEVRFIEGNEPYARELAYVFCVACDFEGTMLDFDRGDHE